MDRILRNFPVEGGGIIPVIITYRDFFAEDKEDRVFPYRMCKKCGKTHPLMDFLWVPGESGKHQVISTHSTCCYRHCGKDGQGEQVRIRLPKKGEELHLRFDLTQENGVRYTWLDTKDHCRYAWSNRHTRYNKEVPDIRFQPYMKR